MAGIAIVIVNYRTPDLALGAVAALAGERAAHPDLRVVLVDGGSGDGSAERLEEGIAAHGWDDWVMPLALPINGGFGWANNQAIQRLLQSPSPPDRIHLLNPDTRIEPGAVSRLAAVLDAHPECGAVGSLLLEPDGSPSGSAFSWPTTGTELMRGIKLSIVGRLLRVRPLARLQAGPGEVDWVTGASVMFRAEALRRAGLFDTGFFLYFEELELMWRIARAGWTIRHEPASRVTHVGGASTGVNGSRPTAHRPAMPAYWYASRRRFLALTRGRRGATIASLAWLGGHLAFLARRAIGGGRQHALIDREARGLLKHGLRPTPADHVPHIARWDDPVDIPPAWMSI